MIENMDSSYMTTQRATLFVSVITSFITTFTGSALVLSIPDISSELAVSAGTIGWIVTVYTLVAAAFSVPFGRIADLTCRKYVLVTGLVIFMIGAIFAPFSSAMLHLMAARSMQAFGASMIFATNHAILISEYPDSERGHVLGYSTAATYVGLSAGPVVGGIINHYLGWRMIFVLVAAIATLITVLAAAKLPKRKSVLRKEHMDVSGTILYVLMIIFVIFSLTEFPTDMRALALLPVGLALGFFFVYHELRTSSPLVDIKMFTRSREYTMSNLTALLNYGATFSISYLISIYLQVVLGFSSQIAGIILISGPVMQAVFSPYAGGLSDRISPFKLATAGMAVCAATLFLMSFLGIGSPLPLIIAILAASGFGFALFSSPNTNAVMSCVDKSQYSVASSLLATMRNLGQTVSMVIVTMVVTFNLGRQALAEATPEALVHTMSTSFVIFTVICIVGIFVSVKRDSVD